MCVCVWLVGRKGVGGDGHLIHGTAFWEGQRVGCSCGRTRLTKTECVCNCVGVRQPERSGRLPAWEICQSVHVIKPCQDYTWPFVCVCVCVATHQPLSARSERCVWSEMWLPQVGFFLSSTHSPDPESVVSSAHPSLLSIYWQIQTSDFLCRRSCSFDSCDPVCCRQNPRTARSPLEISSLHRCASTERKNIRVLRDSMSRNCLRNECVSRQTSLLG